MCDRGFPHSPQVFPQEKIGKPQENRGFSWGERQYHRFYKSSVENFLVYRTLLKPGLGGEDPGVSGMGICLRHGAIHP